MLSPIRPNSAPPPRVLDFSVIDTAQKAELLPVMNVEVNVFNLETMGASAAYKLDVNTDFEQYIGGLNRRPAEVGVQYSLHAGSNALQAQGTVGGVPLKETWTMAKDGTTTIVGTVGATPENLVWTFDRKTHSSHLDGTIGNLQIHKTLPRKGTWQGTVGNATWSEDEKMDVDSDHAIVGLHATGQMQVPASPADGAPASLATQLDTMIVYTPSSALNVARGTLAGMPVQYSVQTQFH